MITVTTDTGITVRPGQLYRDNRDSNVRTLRVNRIHVDGDRCDVHCSVIRHNHGDGRITEPMRGTLMTLERLTGRSFVLVEDGATNA